MFFSLECCHRPVGGGRFCNQLFICSLHRFNRFYLIFLLQPENAADLERPGHVGPRPLGVSRVHVRHVDRRVFQAVEEHRVVRPRAAPDRYAAFCRARRAAGPVTDAGRRRNGS